MTNPTERMSDRRRKQRFPLNRDIRYRLMHQPVVEQGTGTAVNASSAGIAFQCDHPLPVDALIEFSVSWPVSLEDSCPLRLVGKGRVVRCEAGRVACTIDKFEFRTQARNLAIMRPLPAGCVA